MLRLGNKALLKLPSGEVLASPDAETFYFVAFRSSYPLAGCSPAEPASVLLDGQEFKAASGHVKPQLC
jgi:hypothetical protein